MWCISFQLLNEKCGGERGEAGMESVKGPGACGFIDASATALQGFTCSSHLGQEALHACSGGGQASACLLTGRTHKYLDVQMLLSLSERLQVDNGQDANMVALRLVAFALLAAAWYLTGAAEGEVIYACLNDTAKMSCEVGTKINLEHILYKVGVGTRCGEGKRHPDDGPDTFCTFPWAEMVVEDLCGNRRSCEVPVTERVFGEYPCKEETRYLEVSYSCAKPPPPPPPPPPPTKPACEDKSAADV